VKSQDAAFSKFTPEGYSDAISGASMHVKGFYDLVAKAVAAGPTVRGIYKDGVWHAESSGFAASGWKGSVDVLVKNGYIVGVNWSGVDKAGTGRREAVKAGKYVMKKGGVPWTTQANALSAYLEGTQDPAKIKYKDTAGHTDAVSGVSINASEFFDLVKAALAKAK